MAPASGQRLGGAQLVLCGDFLQLPPAEETLAPEMLAVLEPAGVADRTAVSGNRGSCSQAASWRACATGVHRLTTAHRQGDKTALLRGTEPASPSGKSAVAKASVTATVLNLINNVVGAGLFSMPWVLQQSTILSGLLLLCFICVLNGVSFIILAKCCDLAGTYNYKKMGTMALGHRAGVFIQSCILLYTTCSCVSYVVLTGDFLVGAGTGVFDHWAAGNAFLTSRPAVMGVVALTIFVPLCLLKNLEALEHTSCVSFCSTCFAAGLLMWSATRTDAAQRGGRDGHAVDLHAARQCAVGGVQHFVLQRFAHRARRLHGALQRPALLRGARGALPAALHAGDRHVLRLLPRHLRQRGARQVPGVRLGDEGRRARELRGGLGARHHGAPRALLRRDLHVPPGEPLAAKLVAHADVAGAAGARGGGGGGGRARGRGGGRGARARGGVHNGERAPATTGE